MTTVRCEMLQEPLKMEPLDLVGIVKSAAARYATSQEALIKALRAHDADETASSEIVAAVEKLKGVYNKEMRNGDCEV